MLTQRICNMDLACAVVLQAKKGKLGLSKGDEKLLQHAQKQQKLEFLKACVRHCNGDDKCKATCNAPKGKSAVKTKTGNGALKLPLSDMQLLKDAEKRQNKETREKKAMMKNDLAALGDHTTDMSSANDDINHQPAMDGTAPYPSGLLCSICLPSSSHKLSNSYPLYMQR